MARRHLVARLRGQGSAPPLLLQGQAVTFVGAECPGTYPVPARGLGFTL